MNEEHSAYWFAVASRAMERLDEIRAIPADERTPKEQALLAEWDDAIVSDLDILLKEGEKRDNRD